MGIEKRTHPRFPARLRVTLTAGDRSVEARTRDLSLGGMFLECAEQLPYGAQFVAVIDLPALAAPARIPCTVRWAVGTGMGVSFGPLRAAETWAINQIAALHTP